MIGTETSHTLLVGGFYFGAYGHWAAPFFFSFWDGFGRDTHILLKVGKRGHSGWEWSLKFKSIFNLRKCSLAACLKCFTTKADLTQLLSACNHRQQCHNRHRDDYMMIWYFFYLQQVWELLSFRGSVKDALLKLDIVYQEVIFLKGCIENLSAIYLAECLGRKITLALGCRRYAILCVRVCFVCLLVCLLFMFLFDWVLDWWSAVCRQTNVVQLSTFNKKREQFTEQARRRQQCCTMYSYQHRSREAVNNKQAKRQTTMAVDVN